MQNTFADKLGPFGFDPYRMLVVDLMHEFELGVWKYTFIHILRVLYAAVPGRKAVDALNTRWLLWKHIYCFILKRTSWLGFGRFQHSAGALLGDSRTMSQK